MSIKILAVDDSPTIRSILNATLTGAGFEVVLACDGQEGLEELDKSNPDIAITDINMPVLDGFGFIDGVRSDRGNASTPIIVITTETGADLRQRAREAGATGWINKPFNPEKLVKTINRLTHAKDQ